MSLWSRRSRNRRTSTAASASSRCGERAQRGRPSRAGATRSASTSTTPRSAARLAGSVRSSATSASSRRPWPARLRRAPAQARCRGRRASSPGRAARASPCTRAAALTRSSTARPCTVVISSAACAASWRCSEPSTTPSLPAVSPSTRSYQVTRPPRPMRRPTTAPSSARRGADVPAGRPSAAANSPYAPPSLYVDVGRRRVIAARPRARAARRSASRARPAVHEARGRREVRELPRAPGGELQPGAAAHLRGRAPAASSPTPTLPPTAAPSANDTDACRPSAAPRAARRRAELDHQHPPAQPLPVRARLHEARREPGRARLRGVQTPPATRQMPCRIAPATCAAIGGTDPTAAAPATTAHTTARRATYSAEA